MDYTAYKNLREDTQKILAKSKALLEEAAELKKAIRATFYKGNNVKKR